MDAKQRASVTIRMMISNPFNCRSFLAPAVSRGRVCLSLQWWQLGEVRVLVNHMDIQPGLFQPFD